MAEVTYNLEAVVSGLNAKITELETLQSQIEGALNDSESRTANLATLERVISSLEAAQLGRLALLKSCCTSQNCKFVYTPATAVPPARPAV